jgi:hypothetical protein
MSGKLNPPLPQAAADSSRAALQISASFTATDRHWVRKHSATSLHEIEKGAWRILALRQAGNIAGAAALLGMATPRSGSGSSGGAGGKTRTARRGRRNRCHARAGPEGIRLGGRADDREKLVNSTMTSVIQSKRKAR